MSTTTRGDRRLLILIGSVAVVLIAGVGFFAPSSADHDPTPTTYNNGPAGAKVAYLMLKALGRNTSRWERPLSELDQVDASKTTLILADPSIRMKSEKVDEAQMKRFLEHGGRVLATDAEGATLLPEGRAKQPSILDRGLCYSVPEGPGELAHVGELEIAEGVQWAGTGAAVVEQRCGSDAVVVRYAVGKGEAIWWASSMPLSNAGLKNDTSLKLLLASIGDGRDVIFDESLHGSGGSLGDELRGLPLWWLALQALIVIVLVILSFSRRRGPTRMPVTLPRSSPVEFAESMGDLYAKAGATTAATDAARRRLLRMLVREAGVPQSVVHEGSAAIAEFLSERLGGDWKRLAEHLDDAAEATDVQLSAHSALTLVKAMNDDAEEVRAKLRPRVKAVKEAPAAG